MGLFNAIQSIVYFSRGGRLVRWEANKHPRDKNGRFQKIGSSSTYMYGAGEEVSFDGMGANGNASSPLTGRNRAKVNLNPGDRVYATSTGSRVVQHVDGTGTMYVGGSAYDKVHLTNAGVTNLLSNPIHQAKLVHSVPGQIVSANSEQEAADALHGTSQKVPHPKASEGAIHVRVPKGSVIHKTEKDVIVEHKDGSATVYNAKRGTYREERHAGRVLPGRSSSTVNVNHPHAKNGVAQDIPKEHGDQIYPIDNGIVVQHSNGTGTFYPIIDGVVDKNETEAIPEGRVTALINERGGIISHERSARFISPNDVEVPNSVEKTEKAENGEEVTYRATPGDVPIRLRSSVLVLAPDGSARVYSAKTGRVRKFENGREEIPVLQQKPRNVRLGSGKSIEVKTSRLDNHYIGKDSVIVQDSISGDGVKYTYQGVGEPKVEKVSESQIETELSNASSNVVHKQSYFARKNAYLNNKNGQTTTTQTRDTSVPDAPKSDAAQNKPSRPPVEAVGDKSTDAPSDLPSDAVRRARVASAAKGNMPVSPDMVDKELDHPELGKIHVRVEPGSTIRQVDNGYVVTYTNSTKPAILFKPDGHALTGMSKQEINDMPITSQVNSDGSVVDFHEHLVYGGIENDGADAKQQSPIQDIPESMLIFVDTEEERQNFLKLMREQGIEELDGLPIEVKIQVKKEDSK